MIERILHALFGVHTPTKNIGFDGTWNTSHCKYCKLKIIQIWPQNRWVPHIIQD